MGWQDTKKQFCKSSVQMLFWSPPTCRKKSKHNFYKQSDEAGTFQLSGIMEQTIETYHPYCDRVCWFLDQIQGFVLQTEVCMGSEFIRRFQETPRIRADIQIPRSCLFVGFWIHRFLLDQTQTTWRLACKNAEGT